MASKRPKRVRDYASQAGLDVDDALVTLWDAGLTQLAGPESVVAKGQLPTLERALNLPTRAELQTVEYWQDHLGMSRDELTGLLSDLTLTLSPNARRIPKNGVRKLRHLLPPPPPQTLEPEPSATTLAPAFVWEAVGRECDVVFLQRDEVGAIHEVLEQDFANTADPIEPRGVRDENLLESAIMRPQTQLGGICKYPTVPMAASALFHSLIHDHAFYNGNKRTAVVALLVLCDRNGVVLTCTEDELFRQTVLTAQHRVVDGFANDLSDREVLENARWLQAHSRPVDHAERPLKWLRLKRRLADLGCKYIPPSGGGTALNIERDITVPRRSWFGSGTEPTTLRCQVRCPNDGADASPETIHKIRHDLQLDAIHGVDSAAFYQGAMIDSFVSQYSRLLRRLATL